MPNIIFVDQPINRQRLKEIATERFGDMVKGVVDIEKKIMALGGEMHADEEAFLLDHGSQQSNLWGINLYCNLTMPDMLEFDSMINIRPSQNNASRSVEDVVTRDKITEIVSQLISE